MPRREGWGWPINFVVAHYFVDGQSLCSTETAGLLFKGTLRDPPGPRDECTVCNLRLAERRRNLPPRGE